MKKQSLWGVVFVCGAALVQPALAEPVMTAGQLASAIEQGKKTTLLIEFEAGTTNLTSASRAQAEEIAKLLKNDRGLKIQLAFRAGELAKQRAKTLQRELVVAGVRDARVVAKAATDSSTVAFNEYFVFRQ